ncbi:hypothetical protein [Lyngbya confervoides]|uniref:DUF4352 domain-containing protein n=1 Tax=Lyngbya confervoides BDU141951 TaxID=1574623 RepID=A0ABD4T2Z6_9CYAN|nr:hypothetical protein [Lyngbya confervoides]MCM1982927.1 hypothetical protein [Lyngbya confervoides BDU141951]
MAKRQLQAAGAAPASSATTTSSISSNAKFTLLLLGIMLLIGAATGLAGYFFGRNSLRGITQPDINPFINNSEETGQNPRQGVSFLKETQIIQQSKALTQNSNAKVESPDKPDNQAKQSTPAAEKKQGKTTQKASGKYPIQLKSQGIRLDIRSLTQKGDEIELDVAMANGGEKPVQFIYTFLDVTDDEGFALSSEVVGIPETLQPQSETHVGTITIFDAPPGSIKRLNLSLTNYPDQNVSLEVKDIPVSSGTD